MSADCLFIVSGRWDDSIVIVNLARALDPANDGTDAAVLNSVRVTPDLALPSGAARASGQPVGSIALPDRDRLFVINHSGSASPQATARFQHGHAGTIAALSLERALDPANRGTAGAIEKIVPTGTCGPVGAAVTPDRGHLILTSAEGDGTEDGGCRLTVFDIESERVVRQCRFAAPAAPPSPQPGPHASFGAYPNPNGVAISPLGGLVFTANGGTDDVSVLSLPKVLAGREDAEIGRIVVEAGPFGIAASPDGRLIAAANRESARTGAEGNTIALIDSEAAGHRDPSALLAQIRVGSPHGEPSRPFTLTFTPSGDCLLVTCFRTNILSRVRLGAAPHEATTLVLTRPDGAPARPRGLAISPDGRHAAIAGGAKAGPGSGCLHIVDLASMRQVAVISGVGNEPYMLETLPVR